MKKILFVCTGNTCRSPMAGALFTNLARQRDNSDVEAMSAGVYAYEGDPASSMAVSVLMDEFGIDISSHRSKVLDIDDIRQAWLILVMTGRHKKMILDIYPEAADKIYTLGQYAELGGDPDISDPYGGDYDVYKDCAYEIESALMNIMDKVFDNED